MVASNSLFDKPFEVQMVNPDGKKFDRVSRLVCKGTTDNVELVVDVNVEVYPVKTGDKLKIMLCRTLAVEGGVDTGEYNQSGKPTLLDKRFALLINVCRTLVYWTAARQAFCTVALAVVGVAVVVVAVLLLLFGEVHKDKGTSPTKSFITMDVLVS